MNRVAVNFGCVRVIWVAMAPTETPAQSPRVVGECSFKSYRRLNMAPMPQGPPPASRPQQLPALQQQLPAPQPRAMLGRRQALARALAQTLEPARRVLGAAPCWCSPGRRLKPWSSKAGASPTQALGARRVPSICIKAMATLSLQFGWKSHQDLTSPETQSPFSTPGSSPLSTSA